MISDIISIIVNDMKEKSPDRTIVISEDIRILLNDDNSKDNDDNIE